MPEARPELRVEGRDDKWALANLLIHHGMDRDTTTGYPELKEADGIDALLDGMAVAIRLSTGRPMGFVLDADIPLSDRWAAVKDRLASAGVAAPDAPPSEGFIGVSTTFGTRVGVWLMPDNQSDGDLEAFLQRLIAEDDTILPHAQTATAVAASLGARFPDTASRKAVMHAWLAWQEEPGLPYGTAVRAHYFEHDHSLVERFVQWFRRLYDIP